MKKEKKIKALMRFFGYSREEAKRIVGETKEELIEGYEKARLKTK